MHFSKWPGFVVNTVAMIFQIMEASRRADSINLVTTEVGPFLHLFSGQMCLAIESRSRWDHSRFSFVPPLLLQGIEILVFKYRLIQWLQ